MTWAWCIKNKVAGCRTQKAKIQRGTTEAISAFQQAVSIDQTISMRTTTS